MGEIVDTLDEIRRRSADFPSCLVLYSGGIDGTFLLSWLKANTSIACTAVTIQLGGADGAETAGPTAGRLGVPHIQQNQQQAFVADFIAPAIRANALYHGLYPISASLSRPLIARAGVALARSLGISAIAHTGTHLQNTSARFNLSIQALAPDLAILAPFMGSRLSREEKMDYLGVREFHLRPHRCSVDENLWAREIESGFLEDPEQDLPVEDVFTWTRNLLDTPDESATVSLTFNDGLPVAVDGERLPLSEVITRLNFLGGQHGVGRYDGLEDSLFGLKIHETREAPAAQILLTAHRELETAVLDSHTLGVKAVLDAEWVSLAVEGYWYSPLREGLDLAIARLNQGLQGEIRVRLHKGHVIVLSRQAEAGLYHRRIGPAYDSLTSRMPYGVYYGLLGLRYRPPG